MHNTGAFKAKSIIWIAATMIMAAILVVSTSCGSTDDSGDAKATLPFASKEPVDLSDYESMMDHEGESRLVDTDVAEVVKLINDKETFVVFFSYADCPYCNLIMPYLNRAAEEAGQYVGYVNTRKDPSWSNNMEIDNYDLVVKYFGDYLKKDEDGKEHLYTPDMYFIKKGEIVARHDGVVEGADDPSEPLTSAQEDELMKILGEEFEKLK